MVAKKKKTKRGLARRDVKYPRDTKETFKQLEAKQTEADRQLSGSVDLKASQVRTALGVFQWRIADDDKFGKQDHILTLAQALASDPNAELEPILVCRIGGEHYVVDGHHRLSAYLTVKRKRIPARIHKGSVAEARMAALEGNVRDKKPMSRKEKQEAAWQLVKEQWGSINQTAAAAKVSKAQVSIMRKTLLDAQALKGGWDASMGWDRTRMLLSGRKPDVEDWLEKKVAEITNKLSQSKVVPLLLKYPDAAAEALYRISDKLPGMILEGWMPLLRDEIEAIAEELPEAF